MDLSGSYYHVVAEFAGQRSCDAKDAF